MDLGERVARRQRRDDGSSLVVDYGAICPAVHPDEPEDRSRVLERLLDALDPVFRGELPPDTYVHGPAGAGKTAVVRALFAHLERTVSVAGDRMLTTTRARDPAAPAFVYVDGREAPSEFRLYRAVLASLLDEEVPAGGVRTDELRERLAAALAPADRQVVLAVDHLDEHRTMTPAALEEALEPVADDVAWVGVGRTEPGELAARPAETLSVPRYDRHVLEDVLAARASRGLASTALGHGQVRRIAAWADGDAHDALAATAGAATLAASGGADTVRDEDVEAGIAAVPEGGVPVGLVLALPENRRRLLRALVDLEERGPVSATAAAVAARPDVDLSEATVERFLYELADRGVLERVALDDGGADQGRSPSRVEPRFPTLVFRRLVDAGAPVG